MYKTCSHFVAEKAASATEFLLFCRQSYYYSAGRRPYLPLSSLACGVEKLYFRRRPPPFLCFPEKCSLFVAKRIFVGPMKSSPSVADAFYLIYYQRFTYGMIFINLSVSLPVPLLQNKQKRRFFFPYLSPTASAVRNMFPFCRRRIAIVSPFVGERIFFLPLCRALSPLLSPLPSPFVAATLPICRRSSLHFIVVQRITLLL